MVSARSSYASTAVGAERMTAEPTFWSSMTMSSASWKRATSASPRMSTGFRRFDASGIVSRSRSSVSAENDAIDSEEAPAASVAITPGPPAFVTTAISLLSGSGWPASICAASNSS